MTIPALVFLGVLAAIPVRREERSARVAAPTAGRLAPRVAALAVVCLVLGLVIVSALLPAWADSKATSSLAVTTQADEAELQRRGRRGGDRRAPGPDLGGVAARRREPRAEPRPAGRRAPLPPAGRRAPALRRDRVAAAHGARARDGGPAAARRRPRERLLELDPIGKPARSRSSAGSCSSACRRTARRRRRDAADARLHGRADHGDADAAGRRPARAPRRRRRRGRRPPRRAAAPARPRRPPSRARPRPPRGGRPREGAPTAG